MNTTEFTTARLNGLRTADGFWNVRVDDATVGKQYQVVLASRRRTQWFNTPSHKYFWCETIDVLDERTGQLLPFPTELLDFEK